MAKVVKTEPGPPEPNERERRAMDRAAERYRDRVEPFTYGEQKPGATALDLTGRHNDQAGRILHMLDTFGTASTDFASQGAGRVAAVMRDRGEAFPNNTALNAGMAAVSGIAPENETEAMLAVQMVGTHEVAMEMLTRAKLATMPDHVERFGTLATKLLRTFTAQTEALAKLRRGGAQTVRVEHVHVYQGGQAIVGNVNTGGGGRLGNGPQAHALTGPAALAVQADPSMLCPDAGRDPMPVAGREGEGTVPNARRGRRKRGAHG